MGFAPSAAGAQPGQQAAHPFSAPQQTGSPPGSSIGGGIGSVAPSLPLSSPAGFGGAAQPFAWPPLVAASGAANSTQAPWGWEHLCSTGMLQLRLAACPHSLPHHRLPLASSPNRASPNQTCLYKKVRWRGLALARSAACTQGARGCQNPWTGIPASSRVLPSAVDSRCQLRQLSLRVPGVCPLLCFPVPAESCAAYQRACV